MQVGQGNDHILVQLDMPLLHHPLTAHHVDQLLIPLRDLLLHRGRLRIMGNDGPSDRIHVKPIRPDQVFHLPHIQQVFRDVLLSFSFRNDHKGNDKL